MRRKVAAFSRLLLFDDRHSPCRGLEHVNRFRMDRERRALLDHAALCGVG